MDYGIKIITGEFGAGKTYNLFYQAMLEKRKKDIFIISNIPYSFADIVYTGPEDLTKIFKLLVEYFEVTNSLEILKKQKYFRPIVLEVDEGHLYFYSRFFAKNFGNTELIALTQCRKRRLRIDFITQELAQLDSTFRRLVPYIRKYYFGLGFWRWYRDYYLKKDEVDLKNEEIADIVGGGMIFGGYFAPQIKSLIVKYFLRYFDKSGMKQQFFDDAWTSHFITGFGKSLDNDLDIKGFVKMLYTDEQIKFLGIEI